MPYKVIYDEAVSLLKKVGEYGNPESGKIIGDEHESVTYLPDEIIPETELAPTVIRQYQSGEEHIRKLIVRVDDGGNPLDDMPEHDEEDAVLVPPTGNVSSEGAIRSSETTKTMQRAEPMRSGIEGGATEGPSKGPSKK